MSLQGKTIILPIIGNSRFFITLEEESVNIITSHKEEIKEFSSPDIDDVNMFISLEHKRVMNSLEEDIEVIEYLPELPEEIDIDWHKVDYNNSCMLQEELESCNITTDIIRESFTINSFEEL